MNYKVMYLDYHQSGISRVDEEVDSVNIFRTYTEAKERLLTYLKSDRDRVRDRIRQVEVQVKTDFGL